MNAQAVEMWVMEVVIPEKEEKQAQRLAVFDALLGRLGRLQLVPDAVDIALQHRPLLSTE